MKKSRTARPSLVVESPTVRSLPLVELLVDTKAELFELMTRSDLQVLGALLEEDRAALCGPRYAHQPERAASRAGPYPARSSWAAGRSRCSGPACGGASVGALEVEHLLPRG